MDFSVRIAAVRKQMGLSQEEFSELVNMSRRTVAAWESGDRTPAAAAQVRFERQNKGGSVQL